MIASAGSPTMPSPRHAAAQPALDLLHALLGALEPHRPAQLFGLAAGEPGRHHRHAQQLFLEERHPQRPRQDGLERRMRIHDVLHALPPLQIGMHHLPDDRTGPDDRDFDDDVVEALGPQPRQRRHLRARLDLEDPDRVGFLQHPVDRRVVGRQVGEIDDRGSGIGVGLRDPGAEIQRRHRARRWSLSASVARTPRSLTPDP